MAKPDCVTLLKISEVLSVSPDELLGFSSDAPSSSEWSLLRKYRALDDFGQKAVRAVLDVEYERSMTSPRKKQRPRMIKLDFYNYPASAGVGNFLEEASPEELLVKETHEAEMADFVISVSGDSMEPTYNDGDLVLVEKCDTVSIGETGIFIVNGDAYIKELGDGYLLSHNKAYSPIPLSSLDSVYCCGKVIGVAQI